MSAEIFKNISFEINYDEFYSRLQIRKKEHFAEMIKEFSIEAGKIARPRGLYKELFIEEKGEDYIVIDGVKLKSKILCKNAANVNKIFVFLVTCGKELAQWAESKTDLLENFIADAVQEHACRIAGRTVIEKIDKKFKLENPSSMNPGSLGDWPIEQQKELFTLIKNESREIEVRLTDSYLMQPTKSVSGIRFSGSVNFSNCQMCPRKDCPTRVAEYIDSGHMMQFRFDC